MVYTRQTNCEASLSSIFISNKPGITLVLITIPSTFVALYWIINKNSSPYLEEITVKTQHRGSQQEGKEGGNKYK